MTQDKGSAEDGKVPQKENETLDPKYGSKLRVVLSWFVKSVKVGADCHFCTQTAFVSLVPNSRLSLCAFPPTR